MRSGEAISVLGTGPPAPARDGAWPGPTVSGRDYPPAGCPRSWPSDPHNTLVHLRPDRYVRAEHEPWPRGPCNWNSLVSSLSPSRSPYPLQGRPVYQDRSLLAGVQTLDRMLRKRHAGAERLIMRNLITDVPG